MRSNTLSGEAATAAVNGRVRAARARRSLVGMLGAAVLDVAAVVAPVASAHDSAAGATSYRFITLDDQADPTFNQLLRINDHGVIAGYFGSGTPANVHPNKGYTLNPPYGQADYHNENFPGSQQTQVTGLNNKGETVGFWADANGDNFGFVEHNGQFVNVVDPNAPKPAAGTPSIEQLLGAHRSRLFRRKQLRASYRCGQP